MFTRILVPLDGSPRAERALPTAARIARATGATVVLLRVVDLSANYWAYAHAPAGAVQIVTADEFAAAEQYLADVQRTEALADIRLEAHVRSGQSGLAILDAASERHADLIVLCSHGRRGLRRWALGSVAEHVARHATMPVLVVREHGPALDEPQRDPGHLPRVLVPLDGSALAEAAAAPAAQLSAALAAPRQGALHLAMVLMPFEADVRNMPEALLLDGAKAYLARVADRLQTEHPDLRITWSVTAEVDIASALTTLAETGEDSDGTRVCARSDAVAMATHGLGGVARWVLGSITDRVLHTTSLPVPVVRPPEMATH